MTPDERQINAIIEYMENVPIPTSNYPNGAFEDSSYTRWAAEEILIYVLAHHDWSVMKSVENFKKLMNRYSEMSMNTHYGCEIAPIFDIAKRTARDISDIIYAMS